MYSHSVALLFNGMTIINLKSVKSCRSVINHVPNYETSINDDYNKNDSQRNPYVMEAAEPNFAL